MTSWPASIPTWWASSSTSRAAAPASSAGSSAGRLADRLENPPLHREFAAAAPQIAAPLRSARVRPRHARDHAAGRSRQSVHRRAQALGAGEGSGASAGSAGRLHRRHQPVPRADALPQARAAGDGGAGRGISRGRAAAPGHDAATPLLGRAIGSLRAADHAGGSGSGGPDGRGIEAAGTGTDNKGDKPVETPTTAADADHRPRHVPQDRPARRHRPRRRDRGRRGQAAARHRGSRQRAAHGVRRHPQRATTRRPWSAGRSSSSPISSRARCASASPRACCWPPATTTGGIFLVGPDAGAKPGMRVR